MKRTFIVLVLFTFWVAVHPETHACACDGLTLRLKQQILAGQPTGVPPGQADSFGDAVFTGRVTSVKKVEVSVSGRSREMARITFQVERRWVGVTDREVAIYTYAPGNGSCGFPFRKNQRYIVFAQEVESRLVASICGFTAEVRYAAGIIKGLGLGEDKEPSRPPSSPGAKPNSSLNRSGISLDFIRKVECLVRYFPPG